MKRKSSLIVASMLILAAFMIPVGKLYADTSTQSYPNWQQVKKLINDLAVKPLTDKLTDLSTRLSNDEVRIKDLEDNANTELKVRVIEQKVIHEDVPPYAHYGFYTKLEITYKGQDVGQFADIYNCYEFTKERFCKYTKGFSIKDDTYYMVNDPDFPIKTDTTVYYNGKSQHLVLEFQKP